jgi:hypothetical protein
MYYKQTTSKSTLNNSALLSTIWKLQPKTVLSIAKLCFLYVALWNDKKVQHFNLFVKWKSYLITFNCDELLCKQTIIKNTLMTNLMFLMAIWSKAFKKSRLENDLENLKASLTGKTVC